MMGTGNHQKRGLASLLLLVLGGVGLYCLTLPAPAAGEVTSAWRKRVAGVAITVDGQGNVFVTRSYIKIESELVNYSLVKLSPEGDRLWQQYYNGPANGDDISVAAAADGQGNVLVTGYSWGSETGWDYATVKFSPEGQQLWARRYSRPGKREDVPTGMVVDPQGNIYVTGHAEGSGGNSDYLTIKYSPDGEELWVRRFNGPARGWDGATAMALDSQGNLYVTGYAEGAGSNYDYATVKYSPKGRRLWVRFYNGPANGGDRAVAVAVDGQDQVYVTGYSWGGASGRDYATIKYSPAGRRLWVRRYDGPASGWDEPLALAADGQGDVYVTGNSRDSSRDWDYSCATIKYSSQGRRLWVRRSHGPDYFYDQVRGLGLDAEGNIYVALASLGYYGTDFDPLIIKYAPDGRQLWRFRVANWVTDDDNLAALVVDPQGNIYITGSPSFTQKIIQTP